MSNFSSDPRTASIGGSRSALSQARSEVARLHRAIPNGDVARWAMASTTLKPILAVITDQRLVTLPLYGAHHEPSSIPRPFEVVEGKSRLTGRAVDVVSAGRVAVSLVLLPDDLKKLQHASGQVVASAARPTERPSSTARSSVDGAYQRGPVPGTSDGWLWGRPVLTPRDAELMAADHMVHLGFIGTMATPPSGDGGLDAVSERAAAQVKFHEAPSGSPDIQRLRGAADQFAHRLFYATAYTPAGDAAAAQLGIALFAFSAAGVVVPANAIARGLLSAHPAAAPTRNALGMLTFEARQIRAARWAQKIQDAAERPISNRKRKGARQLQDRQEALRLVLLGLTALQDSDNPLYKRLRRERTLQEAEKHLKAAAKLVGVWIS